MPNFTYCKSQILIFIFSAGSFTYAQFAITSPEITTVCCEGSCPEQFSLQIVEITISYFFDTSKQALHKLVPAKYTNYIADIEHVVYSTSSSSYSVTHNLSNRADQVKSCFG